MSESEKLLTEDDCEYEFFTIRRIFGFRSVYLYIFFLSYNFL